MRILLISDISWESGYSSINDIVLKPKNRLDIFKSIINELNPSLVLFAGDIINDGSCRYEHVDEFLDLLKFLENKKIYSFTIKGNHDEYSNYDKLLKGIEELSCAEEISNKIVEFNNIKILGIPFSFTNSLKNLRHINENFSEQVDITLAHSEYARRIWLFELKSKFIITGHSDKQLCQIFDKVFIALGNFPYSYCIIDYNKDKQSITYYRRIWGSDFWDEEQINYIKTRWPNMNYIEKPRLYTAKVTVVGRKFNWTSDEYIAKKRLLHSIESFKKSKYPKMIANLILAKKKIANIDISKQKDIIENLLKLGIPKTHIEEYIGKKRLLYNYKWHP